MKLLHLGLSVSIAVAALVGDYIVFKSKFSHSQHFRAFSDNFTHALIGFLSAIALLSHESSVSNVDKFYNITFCTAISSLIDIDHFLLARSFKLKDLQYVKQRGLFHCSTFWLLITCILLLYSCILKRNNIHILAWMVALAAMTHLIRDGNRRGIWVYPFGHTAALPKVLYVALLAVLPHCCAVMCKYWKYVFVKHLPSAYEFVV